jgi:hypothetical protein
MVHTRHYDSTVRTPLAPVLLGRPYMSYRSYDDDDAYDDAFGTIQKEVVAGSWVPKFGPCFPNTSGPWEMAL